MLDKLLAKWTWKKKCSSILSLAWIICVFNWRGNLNRHNSHLMWNKRQKKKKEERVMVSLRVWSEGRTTAHGVNGQQRQQRGNTPGAANALLDKSIYLFDPKKGYKGSNTYTGIWDRDQPKLLILGSCIFSKFYNSLDDHVQFILTIMFMPRQCIWGLRKSKMCHWEKPVSI